MTNAHLLFQVFGAPPKILLSVRHSGSTERKDMMSFWTERVTQSQFRLCLREIVSFSGAHENLYLVSTMFYVTIVTYHRYLSKRPIKCREMGLKMSFANYPNIHKIFKYNIFPELSIIFIISLPIFITAIAILIFITSTSVFIRNSESR